ncbi:hypothetical protein WMF42_20875 [Sorangium sp. So ce176]
MSSPRAAASDGGIPASIIRRLAASTETSTRRSGTPRTRARISTCSGVLRSSGPVTSSACPKSPSVTIARAATAAMSRGAMGAVLPSPWGL